MLSRTTFNPLTRADYENLGLKPNPLVLAMNGYAAKKAAEAAAPTPASAKKHAGLDLLTEFRDQAAALLGPEALASGLFHKPTAGALWQGFSDRWKVRPHRLSKEGSSLRDVSYDRKTDSVSYAHASSFQVGAYADVGQTLVGGALFKGEGLSVHYGSVGEDRLKVAGDLGKEGTVRVRERVDLGRAGLLDRDQVTVVLNGFSLRCLDYASGYNTRGYGVRVIPVGLKDGVYEFDVEFRIHPEHAPDRPQPDDYYLGAPLPDGTYPMLSLGGHAWAYVKWAWGRVGKLTGLWAPPPMKGNIHDYEYAAKVDYAVIGADSLKAALTEASETPTNAYAQRADLGWFRHYVPPVDPRAKRAVISGRPGFAHGVPAIQGFGWHLENWSPTRKDGRYIREVGSRIGDFDYDPASGRADFLTLMDFSNDGPYPEGYDARHAIWVSLVQFGDGSTPAPAFVTHRKALEKGSNAEGRAVYSWHA